MTQQYEEREPRIRRILVALDVSPHSQSALEAAAELAVQLQAELLGLFVEDVDLLRLAQLPDSREMGSLSSRPRELDSQYLERQLRAQARRARRALARRAERSQVPWSFRVARGAITAELLAAAADADLTILGKSGLSRPGRRLGSTARQMLLQTDRQTMFLERGARLGMPVLIVYDGSPASERALAAATQLLRGVERQLTVLTLAADEGAARALQARAAKWLTKQGLEARYRWLSDADLRRMVDVIRSEGCQVIVLPKLVTGLPEEVVTGLLETLDCPVLFVQ
jgi:nucleotide-binding universal stress UspA family protein